jgi:hypothetical protein
MAVEADFEVEEEVIEEEDHLRDVDMRVAVGRETEDIEDEGTVILLVQVFRLHGEDTVTADTHILLLILLLCHVRTRIILLIILETILRIRDRMIVLVVLPSRLDRLVGESAVIHPVVRTQEVIRMLLVLLHRDIEGDEQVRAIRGRDPVPILVLFHVLLHVQSPILGHLRVLLVRYPVLLGLEA